MQIVKLSTDAASYVQHKPAEDAGRMKPAEAVRTRNDAVRPAMETPVNVKIGTEQPRQEPEASPEEFIQTIEEANKRYGAYDKLLQFSVHKETRQIMIKIVNTRTEEVIAEIPPEKILDMIAQLWEMAGLLVDRKA
jgi:flagellar protein FlaG